MEERSGYTVEITPEAEGYYYEILDYFYKHHSESSADRKSRELLEQAIALENNPLIGKKEEKIKMEEEPPSFFFGDDEYSESVF